MIFFLGASNVLTSCGNYETFTAWLRTYGLVPMLFSILMQCVTVLMAFWGNESAFKMSLRIQYLAGALASALLIWGWVEWSYTEEEVCVGDGDINPRTLALVFLILGSICGPCVLFGSLYKGLCGDMNEVTAVVPSHG